MNLSRWIIDEDGKLMPFNGEESQHTTLIARIDIYGSASVGHEMQRVARSDDDSTHGCAFPPREKHYEN